MQLNPWSTPRPTVIVWMFFLTLSAVFVVGTCGLVTSSVSASTIKQTTITIKPQVVPTVVANAHAAPTLFLPLLVRQQHQQDLFAFQENPPEITAASYDHIGHSPISAPLANSYTFVADSGGDLDQYLHRLQVAGGRLNFTINITAPVVPSDSQHVVDGWLTVQGLEYMKSQRKLSDLTLLQLQVYDVDHGAPGCAEVDHIWVNGHLVERDGAPVVLRGGDGNWDSSGIFVPTYFLRFPLDSGTDGQNIQPTPNEISIEVDSLQCDTLWALEIDWGAIVVRPSLNYGLFFVHGWTGDPSTFQDFTTFAGRDGLVAYDP